MATRNAILSRKHLITHGPSRHHFLQAAISSSYFAEGVPGGKERLVPGEVHYLPIDGHPNVCDCKFGEACLRCRGQHMLVMRIIGIVNTDMFGRSYIFFAVIANEGDIRRLENTEVWKDEPVVQLSDREQLVYGVYDPSRKPRGWVAPCPLTLEQLHSSLLAGAIGSEDMRAEPAKLRHEGTLRFPGTKKPFSVHKHFRINMHPRAHVQISGLNEQFLAWFGDVVEDSVPASELCAHLLQETAKTISIFSAFGGKTKVETTLTEVYFLLEKKPHGELISMLGISTGTDNLFFIRDRTGNLRTVIARWFFGGWSLAAREDRPESSFLAECYVHTRVSVGD